MQKKLNYKIGALKRKFKVKEDFEPGALISKINEQRSIKNNNQQISKTKLSIMGLV